jgi:hypothetical protein
MNDVDVALDFAEKLVIHSVYDLAGNGSFVRRFKQAVSASSSHMADMEPTEAGSGLCHKSFRTPRACSSSRPFMGWIPYWQSRVASFIKLASHGEAGR